MRLTRFGRIAFLSYFVVGWMTLIGGAFERAQAQQLVLPPPPPPAPVFNPSSPYTVPNGRETPVSPGLPSRLPNSEIGPNRPRLGVGQGWAATPSPEPLAV